MLGIQKSISINSIGLNQRDVSNEEGDDGICSKKQPELTSARYQGTAYSFVNKRPSSSFVQNHYNDARNSRSFHQGHGQVNRKEETKSEQRRDATQTLG